jgi:hypothetical protein
MTKTNPLKPFRETTDVYAENYEKYANTYIMWAKFSFCTLKYVSHTVTAVL